MIILIKNLKNKNKNNIVEKYIYIYYNNWKVKGREKCKKEREKRNK